MTYPAEPAPIKTTDLEFKEWRKSSEWMARKLLRRQEALEKKNSGAKPDVVGTVSKVDLITEIIGLRRQLGKAYQQASDVFENGILKAMGDR